MLTQELYSETALIDWRTLTKHCNISRSSANGNRECHPAHIYIYIIYMCVSTISYSIIKLFHGLDETLIDYSLQDINVAVTYNLQRTTKYL